MAILAFQKPDKVIMLEGTDTVGRFEFRPLEPGYGQTIGNALRRILLSSLEGFAITSIKISGVDQEFATIPGVIEGMQDIILTTLISSASGVISLMTSSRMPYSKPGAPVASHRSLKY